MDTFWQLKFTIISWRKIYSVNNLHFAITPIGVIAKIAERSYNEKKNG